MILGTNLTSGKWNTFSLTISHHRRKDDFEPYTEPFRPFNEDELKSFVRLTYNTPLEEICLVSYKALHGGFTICNILLNNRLFTGSSHCIKSDRWLPIRGKMIAFRRAFESEGVELPAQKYFVSDGLVHETP